MTGFRIRLGEVSNDLNIPPVLNMTGHEMMP